jgi:vancomycin resistance protein VanJ
MSINRPKSMRARIIIAGFSALVWLYLASLLAVWIMLYFGGDRWWLATVVLFGPRSLFALPLVALVPAAAIARRRLLWPLAAGAIVVAWPIMGFCVPWARLAGSGDASIRILTCNVDGKNLRADALRALVLRTSPDVVALQEFSHSDEWLLEVLPAGFHVMHSGELALASRYTLKEGPRIRPASGPTKLPPGDALCCVLEAPFGPIDICCVHLFTPRRGLSAVLDRRTLVAPARGAVLEEVIKNRRSESREVTEWLAHSPRPLVAGDFNMPADSRIYRQCWSGFGNAFSQAGWGFGDTKITPLGPVSYGLRIDHVLFASPWRAVCAWVERDIGSDHLPLIADLVRRPGSGD